jgi:hypothetical protein
MRELMHETIGLLNQASDMTGHKSPGQQQHHLNNPYKKRSAQDDDDDEIIPEWDIQRNGIESDKSGTDSGVDYSHDAAAHTKKSTTTTNLSHQKIAEGKIIFSFLPQVLPVSDALMPDSTHSYAVKLDRALEHLHSSWSLLVSTPTRVANADTHEFDQTARAIQQAFAHFVHLILTINDDDNDDEDLKIKRLVRLFMSAFIGALSFDPAAAKHNPNSHMLIYVPKFVEKFVQCLLKFECKKFSLVYTLLNVCESQLRHIYTFGQNEKFLLSTNVNLSNHQNVSKLNHKSKAARREDIEDDSLEIKNNANATNNNNNATTTIVNENISSSWVC